MQFFLYESQTPRGNQSWCSSWKLYFPRLTNINFLLTTLQDHQESRLWELLNWLPKREYFDLKQILSAILKRNVWRSVWRICMWILGLKGLTLSLPQGSYPFLNKNFKDFTRTFKDTFRIFQGLHSVQKRDLSLCLF